ncbi:flagellar basal body P-ring formation chaperone FlgA [Variovorax boronicumulans]|uniref:flagellar basal body P-ring formation chaperone FlgA n=1 Tax=Variovorax boronicumulans TaxID=436515 RepID=UPI0036F19DF3
MPSGRGRASCRHVSRWKAATWWRRAPSTRAGRWARATWSSAPATSRGCRARWSPARPNWSGVVSANRVAPGAPIRKELLRGVAVIQQGQAVKVVAQGPGFVVSTEAKALSGAAVGAVVQARTLDGRVIRGVADEEGQVRLVQ